ncbi:MAG: TetR/AcrR family transcriptional regulator [Bacillota bacterium]
MEIKEKILQTMKNLAARKGFSAVTVDELAAACGISKRTLYRYFQSKEEIVEKVLEELMTGIDRRAEEIFTGPASPPEKLRAMAGAVAEGARFMEPHVFHDLQRRYPHLWEKIDRFRAGRLHRLEQIYREGCCLGYFREVNFDVLFTAFLASLRAVVTPAFFINHAVSLPQAIETLQEIFLHGISSPGGPMSEKESGRGKGG